jgi:hypothetical protein
LGTEPRVNSIKNALSIDLEDWFCVHNLAQAIKRDDWDKCDLRVRAKLKRADTRSACMVTIICC